MVTCSVKVVFGTNGHDCTANRHITFLCPCVARFATSRFAVQRAFGRLLREHRVFYQMFLRLRAIFSLTGHRTPACNAWTAFCVKARRIWAWSIFSAKVDLLHSCDLTGGPRTCASPPAVICCGRCGVRTALCRRKKTFLPSVDVCKNQSDTKKQRHGANVANGSSNDLPRCHSNIRDQYRGSIFCRIQLP